MGGYLPTTHLGLLGLAENASPFGGIPALAWMGANDMVISNDGSRLQAELFTNPTVVVDPEAGHFAPLPENPTYNQVLDFLANNPANSGSATSTTAEISTSTDSPTTEDSTTTTLVIESTESDRSLDVESGSLQFSLFVASIVAVSCL